MNKIKIGGYYILDEACELNLKEYYPVKVKVLKKTGFGTYKVLPIEPVVFPITDDGWAIRPIIVNKKYLSPTSVDEKVVVRCPLNMPKFSKNDEIALTNIYDAIVENKRLSQVDVLRLKAIIHKIRYVEVFNEVPL